MNTKQTDPIVDTYPLSHMQQGMLFHFLLEPNSGVDIEQLVCTLNEPLDVATFRQAWDRVVARHDILRISFHWDGLGEAMQEVAARVAVPFTVTDWRAISESERETLLKEFLRGDRQRGFTMTEAPMIRLALFQLETAKYQLIWTFHHALLDGRSFPIVLREVFAFYEAVRSGQELSLPAPQPYCEYIAWLQRQEPTRSENFWREQLRGFTAPTPLVVDQSSRQIPDRESRQGDCSQFLSTAVTARLKALATANDVTLNTVIQGAWALLLYRYSGEEDIVFGATRACRRSSVEGADDMVGLFINTLPMRVKVNPAEPLLPWLQRLRLQWVAMRDHEHTPLVNVQGWSEIAAGKPLFESILVFENYLLHTVLRADGGAWLNRGFCLYEQTNFPITLAVYSGDALCLRIEFDRRRFDHPTILRMVGHLATLLEGIATNPQRPVGDFPLLTAAERDQLVVEWNLTAADYSKDLCVHQLIEAQAQRTPDAVAVVFEDQHLSYQELNSRANQLAHYLRLQGVGPDGLVGICVERSIEMVVGLLGILKAGGAYVPLDPEYPKERLGYMMEDARTPVILTQRHLLERLPQQGATVICLDRDWGLMARESIEKPKDDTGPENLAYMIYTSGSTGKPKGALNTHQGICNRLLWMQDEYRLTADDAVLQKTPFSFDVSVWEFFWPLMTGARLVMAVPGGHRDPSYLIQTIKKQEITVMHFVPSMLRAFLDAPGVSSCCSLRDVICSGEALSYELQERFFSLLSAKLHNLYGPTEAAVDVTYWACQRESSRRIVPIGRPVVNTHIYILDRNQQPVPIGVPGELHIGGIQVGRGYHNRPELTAEKFIPDPFSARPGAHLYKTGDLARYLADGAIEYLGRTDFQIKIRGFRVELGEIESMLRENERVKDVIVAAREGEAGEKQLVGYVVAKGQPEPSFSELRSFLKAKLPDYMIPSNFVLMEAFPLTPNGKIDRRALPAPDRIRPELDSEFVAPKTEMERTIASIWQEVLQMEKVGLDDNFFDLGGHSLLLVSVHSKLRQGLKADIAMVELFQYPTVASLARKLSDGGKVGSRFEVIQERARLQREAVDKRRKPISGGKRYNGESGGQQSH